MTIDKLVPGLQPLVLWMANSIELLHFIQQEVPRLLHGLTPDEELDYGREEGHEEEEHIGEALQILSIRVTVVKTCSVCLMLHVFVLMYSVCIECLFAVG